MTESEKAIKSLKEMFPKGLCEDAEYNMAQVAINALEKQLSKKQGNLYAEDSHLYIDRDGFVRCFKTKKDIRYPLMSLSDLDYCPRCGQKLDWERDTD